MVCAEQVADRFRPLVPVGRLAVVPLARHAASAPATEAALLGQSPDVVHVNLVDPASNAASIAAGLATAPTTATLHLAGDTGDIGLRARLAGLYGELSVLVTIVEVAACRMSPGPAGSRTPSPRTVTTSPTSTRATPLIVLGHLRARAR